MKKFLLILSLILFVPNIALADSHKIIDADIQEYLDVLGRRDMDKVESYKVLKDINNNTNNNKEKVVVEKTKNSEHIIYKSKEKSNNPKTGITNITPLLELLTLNLIVYKKNKGD